MRGKQQLWRRRIGSAWHRMISQCFFIPHSPFPPTFLHCPKMDSEPDVAPESLFRPVKRRKFMRKRPNDDTDNDRTNDAGSDRNSCPREEIQSTGQNDEGEATEVVRLRRPPPARKGGIGFSTKSRLGQDETQSSALASAEDLEQERIQAMRDRFTGHTGQMVDVDKHMYGPLPPHRAVCKD